MYREHHRKNEIIKPEDIDWDHIDRRLTFIHMDCAKMSRMSLEIRNGLRKYRDAIKTLQRDNENSSHRKTEGDNSLGEREKVTSFINEERDR